MTLSQLLASELILSKAVCGAKDELISLLIERIYSTGRNPPLQSREIIKTIKMREEIGGTLLPSGLSVPHARLRGYEGFIIACALPAEPIFHEGLEIRMMALMISSQSGGPYYLESLAALTKISRDAEYFSRLCKAETPKDFLTILKERDPELA